MKNAIVGRIDTMSATDYDPNLHKAPLIIFSVS